MVKTRNLMVQVFEKIISGQGVNGITTWTKSVQRVHAPGLRGFAGLTISMRKHKVTRARMNGVAVENTSLVQNEKEVDALKFFKEHHYVLA